MSGGSLENSTETGDCVPVGRELVPFDCLGPERGGIGQHGPPLTTDATNTQALSIGLTSFEHSGQDLRREAVDRRDGAVDGELSERESAVLIHLCYALPSDTVVAEPNEASTVCNRQRRRKVGEEKSIDRSGHGKRLRGLRELSMISVSVRCVSPSADLPMREQRTE